MRKIIYFFLKDFTSLDGNITQQPDILVSFTTGIVLLGNDKSTDTNKQSIIEKSLEKVYSLMTKFSSAHVIVNVL